MKKSKNQPTVAGEIHEWLSRIYCHSIPKPARMLYNHLNGRLIAAEFNVKQENENL